MTDTDLILLLNRLVLGGFFVLARFRWIYDPSKPSDQWFNGARHASLENKLCACGYGRNESLGVLVALAEVGAGIALIVGFLTQAAALGLLVVLLFATYCTAREKTMRQNPVDGVGVVESYLWTPEPLYIVLCIIAIVGGAGAFSVDRLLFG